MSDRTTGRRGFLRGVAGTVVGLPLLEYMLNANGTAYADGSGLPCRYFLMLAPTSLVTSGSRVETVTPTSDGLGYATTPGLRPLVDRGVAGDVSAVSGLFCPPLEVPGGYDVDYHGQALKAVLSGQRSGFSGVQWRPQNLSGDELVAQHTAGQVPFRKLYYQVDPDPSGQRISFEQTTGFSGEPEVVYRAIEPEISPAGAYATLFRDGSPTQQEPDPGVALERRLRMSSLSFAGEQIASLNRKLGAGDRRTLDEHLTHVRELERRLQSDLSSSAGAACRDPRWSSGDPPHLSAELPDQQARADLFSELIGVAFACDMTRSLSLAGASVVTGSGMRHAQWRAVGGLHSELQHSGEQADLDAANRWFIDVFAKVLQTLKMGVEGEGTVLDRTAAVFVMEGGKGLARDSQRSGDGGGDPNHSCDNMMMLLGGHSGGLRPGRHINLTGHDRHPTEVLNAALRAVGVGAHLGEISGVVDELFA